MMRKQEKRWIAAMLAVLMLLLCGAALGSQVTEAEYANAPANPTQDNVAEIRALLQKAAGEENYPLSLLEPSALTMDTLGEIFDFVNVTENPVARYFPEEVQNELKSILEGGDIDVLYMAEFMSVMPGALEESADAKVEMDMQIEYEPGRLVIAVLGRAAEDGVSWKALKAEVPLQNRIVFEIPAEELALFAGQEMLLSVLSVKPGTGWEEVQTTLVPQKNFIPSKNSSEIIYVEEEVVISGGEGSVDCRIILVDETEEIKAEMEKLTAWFTAPGKVPLAYFDENVNAEAALLLAQANVQMLIPYEKTQVMALKYEEPYGDVTARFLFPTPFRAEKGMVALIGLPDAEGEFHWTVLHTEVKERYTEITFSSTVLPVLMETPGLLLVMSDILPEEN